MKLIVGLGNPGKEYENTRHNVGAMALEYFNKEIESDTRYSDIGREKNRLYASHEFRFCSEEENCQSLVCMTPLTYMNRSGEAVERFVERAGDEFAPPTDLIVLHDEMDISFGSLKVDRNASSAGHNGVQNIIDQLRSKDFIRIRIGIRPDHPLSPPTDEFVLQKFAKKEREDLQTIYKNVKDALEIILTGGLERAQNMYNKKRP